MWMQPENCCQLHHVIALLAHRQWYCSLLSSIKLHLRIYMVFQSYCFPSCVWNNCIHTWIREFGSILSPIPLLPSPISMASIISPEADQQYIIVKQVTALSTSNLRLIIQAHFLIVLVFWLALFKVNWIIFPHHMLLHHFLCWVLL